jgi:hypothetical protein
MIHHGGRFVSRQRPESSAAVDQAPAPHGNCTEIGRSKTGGFGPNLRTRAGAGHHVGRRGETPGCGDTDGRRLMVELPAVGLAMSAIHSTLPVPSDLAAGPDERAIRRRADRRRVSGPRASCHAYVAA